MYVLGCQVRLLQSTSPVSEPRRDVEKTELVGLGKALLEKVEEVEDCSGLIYVDWCGKELDCVWNAWTLDGTDSRLPGVLGPQAARDGDRRPDGYGLPLPPEKVADVGVPGDWAP